MTIQSTRAIGLAATAGMLLAACDSSAINAAQPAAQSDNAQQGQTQRQFPPKPQLPTMELQAQYQGPFEDTIIQRWRDPIDGRICYLYIPAQVNRDERDDSPFLDYSGNSIGSISCTTDPVMVRPAEGQPQNSEGGQ